MRIVCENLHKAFFRKPVLRGVDLVVEPGENLVVMGRSGEGKSVLLKHLVALLLPDRGAVRVDGLDITRVRRRKLYEVRKRFGMVFQGAALFDSLTVGENVSLALREHTDLSDDAVRRVCEEKLAMVGLEGVSQRWPSELSGGMKKRVGIARAIAMDPECVLYDEPTTGLDPITANVIDTLIARLSDELGITSVVVTHDLESARRIADRIVMLHEGRIVFSGTSQQAQRSDHPVVRAFFEGRAEPPTFGSPS